MNINTVANFLERAGLTWLAPIVRLCVGDDPRTQIRTLGFLVGVPLCAIALSSALFGGDCVFMPDRKFCDISIRLLAVVLDAINEGRGRGLVAITARQIGGFEFAVFY